MFGSNAKARAFRDRFRSQMCSCTRGFNRQCCSGPTRFSPQSIGVAASSGGQYLAHAHFQTGWDDDPDEEKNPETARRSWDAGEERSSTSNGPASTPSHAGGCAPSVHGRAHLRRRCRACGIAFRLSRRNSGIQDVDNVGRGNSELVSPGRPPEALLRSYDAERHGRPMRTWIPREAPTSSRQKTR